MVLTLNLIYVFTVYMFVGWYALFVCVCVCMCVCLYVWAAVSAGCNHAIPAHLTH